MNNLNNSIEYSDVISTKIKDEIRHSINSYDEYILSNNDKNQYNKIVEKSNEIAKNLDNDEINDKGFDRIMKNYK